MQAADDEDELLRSVAIQNAKSILLAASGRAELFGPRRRSSENRSSRSLA